VSALRLLLSAGIVAGCAGGSPSYKSDSPPNLNIRTKLSSPSVLLTGPGGSFEAQMHVTSVDRNCQKSYRGAVRLDSATLAVGLPADQAAFLEFEFSGRFAPARGEATSTYSTLLTPRSGHQYDVDVVYADKAYSITVHERNPHTGARRGVERRPFRACAAKAAT
jgi:hypothetical protein